MACFRRLIRRGASGPLWEDPLNWPQAERRGGTGRSFRGAERWRREASRNNRSPTSYRAASGAMIRAPTQPPLATGYPVRSLPLTMAPPASGTAAIYGGLYRGRSEAQSCRNIKYTQYFMWLDRLRSNLYNIVHLRIVACNWIVAGHPTCCDQYRIRGRRCGKTAKKVRTPLRSRAP